MLVGPGEDPGVDVDPLGGLEVLAVGDQEEGIDLGVERDDDGAVDAPGDLADHGVAAADEDLDDGPHLARGAVEAGAGPGGVPLLRLLEADEDEIAVHGAPQAPADDRRVGDGAVAGEEEALSLALDGEDAGLELGEFDEGVLLTPDPDDGAGPLEVVETVPQRFDVGFGSVCAKDDLAEVGEREEAGAARRERVADLLVEILDIQAVRGSF